MSGCVCRAVPGLLSSDVAGEGADRRNGVGELPLEFRAHQTSQVSQPSVEILTGVGTHALYTSRHAFQPVEEDPSVLGEKIDPIDHVTEARYVTQGNDDVGQRGLPRCHVPYELLGQFSMVCPFLDRRPLGALELAEQRAYFSIFTF